MVVIAVDADKRCAVDLGVENLGCFEIRWNEDLGLEAETRSSGSDSIGQIAGRGASNGVESEGLRVGESDGHHAILEAQRRQAHGIVLDIEIPGTDALAEARRCHQRGQSRRS